jgi:polyphosphate kinase
MKMNALADKEIIELLYRAAEAGVKIDLIVRGICALRPGGESGNNFRIRSILGRYLEHSRMYRFAHGDDNGEPLYLIGSADMMPRNLDKRVEVLVPVEHPKHRAWMDKVFNILMSDDVVSFEMERDGSWARVGPAEFIDSHDAQYLIHTENSHSQTRSDRVQGSQWG